jgi:hypothetical protein
VKIFLAVVSESVGSAFAFLHAALAPNADFGTAITLHFLQTVAARADKQAKEIDLREFLDRDVNFILGAVGSLLLMILGWRTEIRVGLEGLVNKLDTFFLELLAIPDFSSVCTATIPVIRGRWRRRSGAGLDDDPSKLR